MINTKPVPGRKAPGLSVETQHGQWTLSERKPDSFTVLFFYRGLHCPICKKQLEEINSKIGKFTEAGADILAISMDSEARWRKSRADWDVEDVPMAHSLSDDSARKWGLFISKAIKDEEPDTFSEPGVFLIKPDGTLYMASIQSAPFARPQVDDLLKAIDFVQEKEYPARGQQT